MFGMDIYKPRIEIPKEKIEISEDTFPYLVNAVLLKLYDWWAGDEKRKRELKPEVIKSLEVLLGKKKLGNVKVNKRLLRDVWRVYIGLLIEYQIYYSKTKKNFGNFLKEYEKRFNQGISLGISLGYIYKPESSKLGYVIFP